MLSINDRFALFVGKLVITGVIFYGVNKVFGPTINNVHVDVTRTPKTCTCGGDK